MKKFTGLLFTLLFLQGLMFFCDASPLLAEDAKGMAVQDIQAKCKAIDEATSYRKVEVSPTAAAEEGNASDILAGYYDGHTLKKIATHAFGDKGVGITEYYYDHDQLIFVSWHSPSYEGKQPKEDFGQFYFKDGKLISWMDTGGKVVDEGLVKTKDLYAKREISIKGWADEARKRIEGIAKG
jgi:hypothetical protein